MPKGRLYECLNQAYIDTWMDPNSDWNYEKEISHFALRWGGLNTDAFNRTLQQGDAEDRLVALFALGYLTLPEGERLLTPFLDSPVRKERWASASSLGRYKHEQAFSLLQELLTEELAYAPPSLVAGMKSNDPLLLKTHEQLERKETEYENEYDWFLQHRYGMTLLLGSWGDPRAIPVLVQALQQSLALEFHAAYPNNLHIFSQSWHRLQDALAYALGQLGAWNTLDGLDFPPKRLHIAHRYLVFGAFNASVPWVFDSFFLANWGKDGQDISSVLAYWCADLTLGLPDNPTYVHQMIQERFALYQERPVPSFHEFLQWHNERNDEWQDRWDAAQALANQMHPGLTESV